MNVITIKINHVIGHISYKNKKRKIVFLKKKHHNAVAHALSFHFIFAFTEFFFLLNHLISVVVEFEFSQAAMYRSNCPLSYIHSNVISVHPLPPPSYILSPPLHFALFCFPFNVLPFTIPAFFESFLFFPSFPSFSSEAGFFCLTNWRTSAGFHFSMPSGSIVTHPIPS